MIARLLRDSMARYAEELQAVLPHGRHTSSCRQGRQRDAEGDVCDCGWPEVRAHAQAEIARIETALRQDGA